MALVQLNFLKLDPEAKLPTQGTKESAGHDFYSLETVEIKPKQTIVVPTGLSWEPSISMKDRDKRYNQLEDHKLKYSSVEEQMMRLQEFNEEIYSFYANNYVVRMEMSSRSSLFSKHGIIVSGKIDQDYRGPIGIMIHNASNQTFKIKKHDRIAQGEIGLVPTCKINEVKSINETKRGSGGFGSTGVK